MKERSGEIKAPIHTGKTAAPCRRLIYLLLGMQILLLAAPPSPMAAERFRTAVGFSVSTFLELDKERALSITSLWSSLVARKWGGTASTVVFRSVPEPEKSIQSKNVDLLVLLPSEFVELKGKTTLEPLFVSAKGKDIFNRLVLVVRRDSGYRSVSDLKGKTVIQPLGLYGNGRNLWLDTLLMRKGIKKPESFFSKSRQVLKPSAAILPVFFRKEDACIVTRLNLQVMSELNPQLSKELQVLEESPPRPSSVIAVRKELPARHKEIVREVLSTLDRDAQGKQLLTLFRMDRLVPYRPEYMANMEELLREHRDLQFRLATRK